MADEQHRLRALPQPFLQPALARYVEEVVGLVEEQHLVAAAQQQLQRQPLLLAAREGDELAVLAPLVGRPERGDGDGVPEHLGVVAADIAPVPQRMRIAELAPLVVALHYRQLALLHAVPGLPDVVGCQPDQEVLDRGGVAHRADELAHHPEPAHAGDGALLRDQIAGDQAQQRGLAGAVRADQRGLAAVADTDVDVGEQHPPVRERVRDAGEVDVAHGRQSARRPGSRAPRLPPPIGCRIRAWRT